MMPSASNNNNKKLEKRASVSSAPISGIGSGNPIVNNNNKTVENMKKSNNIISNGSNGTANANANANTNVANNKASKEKAASNAAIVVGSNESNTNCASGTGNNPPSTTGSVSGVISSNQTVAACAAAAGSTTSNTTISNNNDPLKMSLVAIEHKIRNLEKRKTKLESYRAIQANGKELSTDQKNAVAKYDSVMATLEFARDFAKQMTQFTKDAEKEQKKQARKDAIAKAQAETAKIREVIVIQNILSCFSEEVVRTDFLNGENGAVKLEAEEMEALEKFCMDIQARRPESSEDADFVSQAQKAAELFSMTIDARPKGYGNTTFEKMRSTFVQIQECGYLDKIYMDAVPETEAGGDASSEHAKPEPSGEPLDDLEKGLTNVKLINESVSNVAEGSNDTLTSNASLQTSVVGGGAVGAGGANITMTPTGVAGIPSVEGANASASQMNFFISGKPTGGAHVVPVPGGGGSAGAGNVLPGTLVGATLTNDGKQQQILLNPANANGQTPSGLPLQPSNVHFAPITVDAVEQAFKHQQQQQQQQHQHHHAQQTHHQAQQQQQSHVQQLHQKQQQQIPQQYLPQYLRPLSEVIGGGNFFFLQDSEIDSPEAANSGVPPSSAASTGNVLPPPPGVTQLPLSSMVNINQKVVVAAAEQNIQGPLDDVKTVTQNSLDSINPLRNDPQQQLSNQQKLAQHQVTAQSINSQSFTNQSFPQNPAKPQTPQLQQQSQKLQQQTPQAVGNAGVGVGVGGVQTASLVGPGSIPGNKTPVSLNDHQQQSSLYTKQQQQQQQQQAHNQQVQQQQQLFTSPVSFAQIQKQQQQQQMSASDSHSQKQPMMILSRLAAPQARLPPQSQQQGQQQSQASAQQLHHQKSQPGHSITGGSNSSTPNVLNHHDPASSNAGVVAAAVAAAANNKVSSNVAGYFDTLAYEQQIQLAAKINAAAVNVEKAALENVAGGSANDWDSNLKQVKASFTSAMSNVMKSSKESVNNNMVMDASSKWNTDLTPNSSNNSSNSSHLRKNDWASTAAAYGNDSQAAVSESSSHWGHQSDNLSPYVRGGNGGNGNNSSGLRSSANYQRRDDQRGNGSNGRPGSNGNGNGGYRARNANSYGGVNNNGLQTNGGRASLYRNDPSAVGSNGSYYQNGGGAGGVYGKDSGPRYDAGGSYRGPRGNGGMNSNNGNGSGGPVGNGNGRGNGGGPSRGLAGRSANNPNASAAAYMRQTGRISLGLDSKN